LFFARDLLCKELRLSKKSRFIISSQFTESERNRFRNLLELANSSKFKGERENALAAATRIAQKHGMTLDEAAKWKPSEDVVGKSVPQKEFYQRPRKGADSADATSTPPSPEEEKKRWQTAVDQAKDRGLDKAEEAKKAAQAAASARRSNSKTRRDPTTHANILLKETSFSFEEIADITGLSVYKVIAMKLKSRDAA
jgi:hypothetical protein